MNDIYKIPDNYASEAILLEKMNILKCITNQLRILSLLGKHSKRVNWIKSFY